MEALPDGLRPGSKSREELILWTAVTAFAQRGYDGTSLREIATSAGVSLSLLSHHFGSKSGLLRAVVHSLQTAGAPYLAELRASLEQAPDAKAIASAWVQYARDAFGHRTGAQYLRLLLRLQSDPAVAGDVRSSLDASESIVRRRLTQLFPSATPDAVELAWAVTTGALYAALAGTDASLASAAPSLETNALKRYLAGGLHELLAEQADLQAAA